MSSDTVGDHRGGQAGEEEAQLEEPRQGKHWKCPTPTLNPNALPAHVAFNMELTLTLNPSHDPNPNSNPLPTRQKKRKQKKKRLRVFFDEVEVSRAEQTAKLQALSNLIKSPRTQVRVRGGVLWSQG